MTLLESGEMYLETILILSRESGFVRAVDIGDYMGYSKPSVCRAVGLLKKDGYLTMAADGVLTLTDVGCTTAKKIFERHTVLSRFLALIGVDGETAAKDACKMEHVVSDQTIAAIKDFMDKK